MIKKSLLLFVLSFVGIVLLTSCLPAGPDLNELEVYPPADVLYSQSSTQGGFDNSELSNQDENSKSPTQSENENSEPASPPDKHIHKLPAGEQCDDFDKNTHTWTCECGKSFTEAHTYEYSITPDGHILECMCSHSLGLEAHILINGKCQKCGWADNIHKHFYNFSGYDNTSHVLSCSCGQTLTENHRLVFLMDENYHAAKCECGYYTEKESHVYNGNICIECGYERHQCTITDGYFNYDEEIHYWRCDCGTVHSASHFYENKYDFNEESHFTKCECGYTKDESKHTFSDGKCIVCGYEQKESENLQFKEVKEGYVLVGIGNCTTVDIKIPSMHNGKKVVGVGARAFEGNSKLVSVYVPDTVASIGESAFSRCPSLQSVRLPRGLTRIEENTFFASASLVDVNLPESLVHVGMSAFNGCKSFVGFGDISQLEYIGKFAFYDCLSIKGDVTLIGRANKGRRVEIGEGAFSGCSSITSLTVEASSLIIGGDAFLNCSSLKTVEFSPCLNEGFDIGTFSYCSSLERITFRGVESRWMDILADSVYEEMGSSWFKGSGDFTVVFEHPTTAEKKYMKIIDVYKIIDETYWQ